MAGSPTNIGVQTAVNSAPVKLAAGASTSAPKRALRSGRRPFFPWREVQITECSSDPVVGGTAPPRASSVRPSKTPFDGTYWMGHRAARTSTAAGNGRSPNRVGVKRRREFQSFPKVRR